MRKTALAFLAVALVAPAAAASGTCVAVADPSGDHGFAQQRVPAAPDGLDLTNVHVAATDTTVTAVFTTGGSPRPPAGVTYHYRFFMDDAAARYELFARVFADRAEYFVMVGDPDAPLWQPTHTTVTGTVDDTASTITLTAPAAAFGTASLTGRSWDGSHALTMIGVDQAVSFDNVDHVDATGTSLVPGDGTC